MKVLDRILSVIAFLVFNIVLLGITVYAVIFSKAYLLNRYTVYGVSESLGISREDLCKVTEKLLAYAKGLSDSLDITVIKDGESIDFFNKKDISHMTDVASVLDVIRQIIAIGTVIFVVILAVLIIKKAIREIAAGYLIAESFYIAIILFVGIFAAVDLKKLIKLAHKLIFSNFNWVLNPARDNLIYLCPEQLFTDSGILCGSIWLSFCIIGTIASIFLLRSHRLRK